MGLILLKNKKGIELEFTWRFFILLCLLGYYITWD
jgi:hypothetical protein